MGRTLYLAYILFERGRGVTNERRGERRAAEREPSYTLRHRPDLAFTTSFWDQEWTVTECITYPLYITF